MNFRTQFGDKVFFDANGDPPASYDIINWQLIDGQVQHVALGQFASDDKGDYKLSIQAEEIVWRTGKQVNMKAFLSFTGFELCVTTKDRLFFSGSDISVL